MRNIIFNKLSANKFLKELDDLNFYFLLSIENIRHAVNDTLQVYESNGESNEYLKDIVDKLQVLQSDYEKFLNGFSNDLKNIGDTCEESDNKVVNSVDKADTNVLKGSIANSINDFVESSIAKPLTKSVDSVKNAYEEITDKLNNSSKDSNNNSSLADIIDGFSKK